MSGELSVGIAGLNSAYWPTAFADWAGGRSDVTLDAVTALDADAADVEANLGMTADAFETSYGVDRVADLDALATAVDAALVCTRNTAMPETVVGSLERGLDVYAAKPIAVEVDGLRAIGEAVAETDRVFTAGQTGRNHAAVSRIRDLVDSGAIGDVHTVRVMHQHGRLADLAAGTWYADPTEGTACHWLGWYPIDAAVSILGRAVELQGDGRRLANDFEGQPDHLQAIVRHESDRTSSLDVYCDVGGEWEVDSIELEVVGSDGIARYRAPGDSISLHQDGGRERVEYEDGNAFDRDLDVWVDARRGSGTPALDPGEALNVAAAGCAWQDALDGEWTPVEGQFL
jgi:predicted dehydrogenase